MRKMIFFVISEEDAVCPECVSPLCRRDKKRRVHKEAGGRKHWFVINRLKCTNEKCGACSPGCSDRGLGNIGTVSESSSVTAHEIFNSISERNSNKGQVTIYE